MNLIKSSPFDKYPYPDLMPWEKSSLSLNDNYFSKVIGVEECGSKEEVDLHYDERHFLR